MTRTPTLTVAEVLRLGLKYEQPSRSPGEILACFVPGRLTNPLNERHGVPWFAGKQARYKRQWKERIADAVLMATSDFEPIRRCGACGLKYGHDRAVGGAACRFHVAASTPKRIHFHAIVPSAFDSTEGLRAALKPFPDALKACGIIDDDRDSAGHEFAYTQTAKRKNVVHGVEIRVRLR